MLTLSNVATELKDDTICLRYIYSWADPKYWALTKAISVELSSGRRITIPEGFTTDLSSSPRLLWGIAPPFGDFLLAALIHDYLYVHCLGTRKDADREMFRWSRVLNTNRLDNRVRFWAVRIFGGSWWRKSLKKFGGQPQPWPDQTVAGRVQILRPTSATGQR